MKMIEIYGMDGKVKQLINGDKILGASPMALNGKDRVQIECSGGEYIFYSYETLENFQKRTGDQWVELERWGDKIKVKKSEIVAYSQGKSEGEECVVFKTKGSESSIICDESIESFEAKLGIKRERQK